MSRKALLLGLAMAFLFVLIGSLPATSQSPGTREPEAAALESLAASAPSAGEPRVDNFEVVGTIDPIGLRDYADVWALGDFAYLGTRCGSRGGGGYGVQVIDISDPSAPVHASTLATPRFTRAEDVVVRSVDTPSFTGDLAVVGIQSCFGTGYANRARTGLTFFDVTDAYNPVLLDRWVIQGPAIGCHEIDFVQRPDGMVLAGCAHNLVDQAHGLTGVEFVDATDPTDTVVVGDFSLGLPVFDGVGCSPITFDHSVRFADQGTTAYLSYWDAGAVNLDVSDPGSPSVVGTAQIAPPDEEGETHSVTLARGGQWLVVNPEDFAVGGPCDGWGEAYVFDNSDPANPALLGSFSTKNSDSDREDGAFTVHNTEVWSEKAESFVEFMSSWYSDGIVWWRMSQDGTATQLGQFVPARDGAVPAVWGVHVIPESGLVLASDFTTGLWIVTPTA